MEPYEAANLARALPRHYAERLPRDVIDNLEIIARGGETIELLDELVTSLAKYGVTVTAAEHDELTAILSACKMPAEMLNGVNITG